MNWLLTFLMLILVPMAVSAVSAVFNVIFMIALSKFLMYHQKREWEALVESCTKLDEAVDMLRGDKK